VSYQIEGTVGRRVQRGRGETPMINSDGKMEILNVNMNVESIEGFSGHSDRKQLFNYVRRISPKLERIIICHGERGKCLNMLKTFRRTYQIEVLAPNLLETVTLR
ncbi:MAG: beta-CASP ribonuclease aCPSF1, partial [Candidatus Bathyarchaeota archaeon]